MKLISNELVSLINAQSQTGTSVNVNVWGGTTGYDSSNPANIGQINNVQGGVKNLLVAYFKRRALGIIYLVVVLMLLVTTSITTDLGFNIGQFSIDLIKSLLGF